MQKTYLLTPGPTPVPEEVHAEFAKPLLHHRTVTFEKLFTEVRDGLKWLFQTKEEVLLLASSGTGGMEAAITNLFSPGEKVITIAAGKFGERWGKIAKAYHMNPVEIRLEPGRSVTAAQLEQALDANPDATAVLFQASETSTGACMPVKEIVDLCRKRNLLSVCDAITACGVMNLPMDEWGIDVMITGSQKALMIPPGLAFIALSANAWKKTESAKNPRFYFDLNREKKAHLKNQTAWTPATSLIQGLRIALRMMQEEGLPQIFARHETLALATRKGVEALGLEILAREYPSPAVTAVKVPSSISDGKKIPKLMKDRHGVIITGGQDELEGKIFRLSHFGYCAPFDVTTGLSALELTLKELGHSFELGSGLRAALTVFNERKSQ